MELENTSPGRFRLSGEATLETARGLVSRFDALEGVDGSITLEMLALDLEEGTATAGLVDLIRLLLARGLRVRLEDAPHELAHVLYRIGALGRVELIRPRVELPTVS